MRKCLSVLLFAVVAIALSAVPASAQTASCTPGFVHCANLSWTPASSGPAATGFNIYRSTQTGGCANVKASTCSLAGSTGNTSFIDESGLAASTTYFWVVSAVNAAGESGPSNEVSATTAPDPPPSAPTGLTVVAK